VGPIAVFDKSFLQSLTVDESVWFDRFFLGVVCPIFYVETLADLSKKPRGDRTAEAEVGIIADKFPEVSGSPCGEHSQLAALDTLGIFHVPMDGRIPRSGGRNVTGGNHVGVVFDESPEAAAFRRWGREEFYDVERMFAAGWRAALTSADIGQIAPLLRGAGITPQSCKSFPEAKRLAKEAIEATDKTFERLRFAVRFFNIDQRFHAEIIKRWAIQGKPPLQLFAPYAAFVLTVEVFFQICLAANLISADKPSNRTDIGYLLYLPFCMIFVSSDRLHQQTSRLFLREDQDFVWGIDLKADLRRLNGHYLATFSEVDRERGLFKLIDHPPTESDYLVTKLWKRHLRPEALSDFSVNLAAGMTKERQKKLVDELNAFTKGTTLPDDQVEKIDDKNIEAVSVERRISRQKGSWWQVPKDLPDPPSRGQA
jgi:hypothetical protein